MPKLKFFKSLKLRLFVIFFILGAIPSLIVYKSVLHGYEERAVKVRISDVQTQLNILSKHLLSYNYLIDSTNEVINSELNLVSNLYNGRVMVINRDLKILNDTYGISQGKTMVSDEIVKCILGTNTANYDEVNGYIEITVPIVDTITALNETDELHEGDEVIIGVLLASTSTDTIKVTLEVLEERAKVVEAIMLIVLLCFSVVLSRLLIRPIDKISSQIKDMKAGFEYEDMSMGDYLETEHIATAFNELISKMRLQDERRKQFVSDVSHELKTPLTSVKVLADSLNADTNAPAELYREFMGDIANEIEREDKIINDLLSLVKLDKDTADLNITSVDINALSEIILKRMRPIARKADVELTLVSLRPVTAEVDEVKMSQILTNLVENAIKYNKPQGKVTVSIDADHQFFTIDVEDTGCGIPEEDRDLIYERFFRVDKSHSREIGGTGLGLSIAKSAVMLHKGSLTFESTLGQGTVFTVKIPLMQTLR